MLQIIKINSAQTYFEIPFAREYIVIGRECNIKIEFMDSGFYFYLKALEMQKKIIIKEILFENGKCTARCVSLLDTYETSSLIEYLRSNQMSVTETEEVITEQMPPTIYPNLKAMGAGITDIEQGKDIYYNIFIICYHCEKKQFVSEMKIVKKEDVQKIDISLIFSDAHYYKCKYCGTINPVKFDYRI